jgi:hypothetical protein
LPTAAPKPREPVADDIRLQHLFDDDEGPAVSAPALAAAPIMPPMARRTDAEPQTKKVTGKRKKKKAKGKAPEGSDALDPRVIGGVFLGAAALVAFMGWFVYDSFLKPASIVGVWQGSRLDYEVSQYLTHSSYRLVLDAQKRATLIQDGFAASGTYTHKGNQLTLKLVDDEGGASDIEYRVALGRATMDLFEPESGTKVVQLVRQDENPAGGEEVPAPAAPVDIAEAPTDAAAGEGEGGEAGDAELVSVEFSPKDGAFRIRHPEGWKEETGSRPDNTYSWARFTKGSGKIQIFADVAGSLMSGSNFGGRLEEGSPSAPVQTAHELYREKAAEEFSDYRESEPTLFKGSRLGEGRIAAFTASGGGLFGSKLRGYRVTHLTNDRRVTILCSSPDTDFEKLKPVFLAACRSLSN